MSEWFKETDLSPVVEIRVGSNPTARIFCFENLKDVQHRNIEIVLQQKPKRQHDAGLRPFYHFTGVNINARITADIMAFRNG